MYPMVIHGMFPFGKVDDVAGLGIRTIRLAPAGNMLAAGDKFGDIKIFDLVRRICVLAFSLVMI